MDSLKDLIGFIAGQLVDKPEAITVEQQDEDDAVVISLRVGEGDLGKVIGRQGRTARAMRTVLAASAARFGKRGRLDILE